MELSAVVLVCNDEYFLPYALEASRDYISRYVIYDVGSTDRSPEIIKDFMASNKQASYYVRFTPLVDPAIQGIFRNSMIAEALSDWIYMIDGDEVYSPDSYEAILKGVEEISKLPDKIYGIVRRIEIDGDSAYGLDSFTPHHRLYHRTAIWTGKHPGEIPYFKQEPKVEYVIPNVTCYHFHNCYRSSKDEEVPKRIERRSRGTYRPGEKKKFDLYKHLPILKTQIADFKRSPSLMNVNEM